MSEKVIDPRVPQGNKQNLTKEKIKAFLPKGTAHVVSDKVLEMILKMEDDTNLLQDYMEESFISHLNVLKTVKVSMKEYVDAIKYCNLKRHQNLSNEKAWAIVFPSRYDKLIAEGRYNSSHSSMYNQTDIVTTVDAQMYVADSIQYAPYRHASIKKQFDLMNGKGANIDDFVSPNVQHLASKALWEMTVPDKENVLNVKMEQTESQFEYNKQMNTNILSLIEMQKQAFKMGLSVEEMQKVHLVQHSGESVEDAEIVDDSEYDDYLEGSMFMRDD